MKIVRKVLLERNGSNNARTRLKVYFWNTWRNSEQEGIEYISRCLGNRFLVANVGNVGIAFLYGYEQGETYVDGADLIFFREPESEFTMLDSFTIEREGQELKNISREKGVMCNFELHILHLEDMLRINCLREGEGIDGYLRRWPELPSDLSSIGGESTCLAQYKRNMANSKNY